jgi:Holliday junction resolvase-like predicted endonuclease
MATKYESGRASEYKVQKELEAQGYCTTRAAGSKGKIDVIAWNDEHTRFIQVKTFLTRVGSYKADILAIEAISFPPNATAELWIRQRGKPGWLSQIVIKGGPPTWPQTHQPRSPASD